jgi:phosphinothricin acetyltransferase
MDYIIRDATEGDLDAINDIYNESVLNSTATFQQEPVTRAERLAWWAELRGRFPVLVAESAGRVIGWANLGPYKSRCGYRYTVESSVYLAPDARGQGLGRAIMTELLSRIAPGQYRTVIAVISAETPASLRLHEQLGFVEVGRLREVGWKFERWLDVVLMQRMTA